MYNEKLTTATKKYTTASLVIIIFFLACLLVRHQVLKNYYKLKTAPALSSQTSLALSSSADKIPEINKNFSITYSKYFDGGNWAIVTLNEGKNSDKASIILEKINGVYTLVLGPGTNFSSDVLKEMPSSVALYLVTNGFIQ
jgi:hypothetical protein